jgi:hypothetical protein
LRFVGSARAWLTHVASADAVRSASRATEAGRHDFGEDRRLNIRLSSKDLEAIQRRGGEHPEMRHLRGAAGNDRRHLRLPG